MDVRDGRGSRSVDSFEDCIMMASMATMAEGGGLTKSAMAKQYWCKHAVYP